MAPRSWSTKFLEMTSAFLQQSCRCLSQSWIWPSTPWTCQRARLSTRQVGTFSSSHIGVLLKWTASNGVGTFVQFPANCSIFLAQTLCGHVFVGCFHAVTRNDMGTLIVGVWFELWHSPCGPCCYVTCLWIWHGMTASGLSPFLSTRNSFVLTTWIFGFTFTMFLDIDTQISLLMFFAPDRLHDGLSVITRSFHQGQGVKWVFTCEVRNRIHRIHRSRDQLISFISLEWPSDRSKRFEGVFSRNSSIKGIKAHQGTIGIWAYVWSFAGCKWWSYGLSFGTAMFGPE